MTAKESQRHIAGKHFYSLSSLGRIATCITENMDSAMQFKMHEKKWRDKQLRQSYSNEKSVFSDKYTVYFQWPD